MQKTLFMSVTLKDIYESIETLRSEIKDSYVSKDTYNAEVPPIKDALVRINWIVISAVVMALLSLVIRSIDVLAKWSTILQDF